MFNQDGQRQVCAFLEAMRRLADPHRGIMADRRPCVLVTGGKRLGLEQIIALTQSASRHLDADLVHLEFKSGDEASGPSGIQLGLLRNGIVHTQDKGAIWVDPAGRPYLLMRGGKRPGLASFDPAGLDYRPVGPATSVDEGLRRGREMLLQMAAELLPLMNPANDDAKRHAAVA